MTGYKRKRIRNFILLGIVVLFFANMFYNNARNRPDYRIESFWDFASLGMLNMDSPIKPPIPTEDIFGNPINVPDNIQTIVTIGPGKTEILTAMGHGGKIIATDTDSLTIPGVPPGIPSMDINHINADLLIELKPDIIFVTGGNPLEEGNPLSAVIQAGGTVIPFPEMHSIHNIRAVTAQIGLIMNDWIGGMNIVADILNFINFLTIQHIRNDIPDDLIRSVYFESNIKSPLFNELLSLVNVNIIEYESVLSVIDYEGILSANPDIIITNISPQHVYEIKTRTGWENISAIQTGNVHYINTGGVHLPTAGIIDILIHLYDVIYPDYTSIG
jgi:iron complex transport system substrate-binding protein